MNVKRPEHKKARDYESYLQEAEAKGEVDEGDTKRYGGLTKTERGRIMRSGLTNAFWNH